MSDCLFCKIVAGEIPADTVYEDDKVIVFRDINPKAEVHLLVIPREHIPSLNELSEDQDALLGNMLHLLPQLAKAQGLNDGFRTIINTGKGGGQLIFHLHMHLLGGKNLPGFE
ncbi:MAG: histidine triad nucleotide-binding protein [Proteobacteria bacterium]|jgi:histidine triad (HIT) family protein|nr:histidine triad nucleotide-binding protein [Pseudomonadota bacterium]